MSINQAFILSCFVTFKILPFIYIYKTSKTSFFHPSIALYNQNQPRSIPTITTHSITDFSYEGTMMLDVPHGKGTIIFGNGGGGGIQRSEPTDKYEGEFDTGFAHGLGQYSSTNKSKVFRGEYSIGQRHGCGAEYDMSPYIKKVNEGEDADTAWAETKDEIENKAKYGTWLRDAFFTGPDDSGRWCHINEIKYVW